MRINNLHPAIGSTRIRKRRGRGVGSGLGKTGARGHKGQKSRSGGGIRKGFEGGQMPLQRRLPKFGFRTHRAHVCQELRICALERIAEDVVMVETLKSYGLVSRSASDVKLFGVTALSRSFTVTGVRVSKGARAAIESAGGKVEDY